MKICPKCGTEVEKKFCPDCGTEFPAVEDMAGVTEAKEAVEAEVMTLPAFEGDEAYHHQETVDERVEKMGGKINAKITNSIAYLTWIGFIIAYIFGDRKNCMFHLNQAFLINIGVTVMEMIAGVQYISYISLVGSVFFVICRCMGVFYAVTDQEKEVPLLGKIKILR